METRPPLKKSTCKKKFWTIYFLHHCIFLCLSAHFLSSSYRKWSLYPSSGSGWIPSGRARGKERPETIHSSEAVVHSARACTEGKEIRLWAEHQKCSCKTDYSPSATGKSLWINNLLILFTAITVWRKYVLMKLNVCSNETVR